MRNSRCRWTEKAQVVPVKIFLIAIGLSTMSSDGTTKASNLAVMLPAEAHGWKPEDPDSIYNAENLYEYIDGAAEVYRSFNVRTVLARRYVKDGGPDILVDIFDMGSSKDAFGAYYHDMREGPEAGIGKDSEFMRGALYFWKGRYFVSIIAFDETEEAKLAVLDLGKVIASSIVDEGAEPDLVKLLPKRKHLSKQINYFHNHSCLNIYYFLAEENLFNLGRETEGILARYKSPAPVNAETESASFVLLLIRYPSMAKAEKACRSFLHAYLPDADGEGMAQTEDFKWTSAKRMGNLLIGVFDAPSKTDIVALVDEVEKAQIE